MEIKKSRRVFPSFVQVQAMPQVFRQRNGKGISGEAEEDLGAKNALEMFIQCA